MPNPIPNPIPNPMPNPIPNPIPNTIPNTIPNRLQVFWKQFAIDFDNIPLPDGPPLPDPTPEIWEAMRDMNVYLDRNGIDLEKDFEA